LGREHEDAFGNLLQNKCLHDTSESRSVVQYLFPVP
jgi:hypothetical protein